MTVTRRQELLATAFMKESKDGSASLAFSLLVKRLQESLSRMEEFEVELAAQTPNEGKHIFRHDIDFSLADLLI